jgi:hypothetical protein
MTNFHVPRGDALESASAEAGCGCRRSHRSSSSSARAGLLMMLGAIAALVRPLSSTGVIGRMTVSNEGTVLLGGLEAFSLGFMAWLA